MPVTAKAEQAPSGAMQIGERNGPFISFAGTQLEVRGNPYPREMIAAPLIGEQDPAYSAAFFIFGMGGALFPDLPNMQNINRS